MKPQATICIPTTRSSGTLSDCLHSLESQPLKQFEVLLITKEPYKPTIKTNYPLKIIQQKQPGLVGAMNDALAQIKSPITIRIDDDVVLDKNWFKEIIAPFEKSRIGAVSGPTIIDESERSSRDLIRWITNLESTHNMLLKPIKWLYLDYLYEGKIRQVGKFLPSGVFTLGSNFSQSTTLKKQVFVDHVEACNGAFRTELVKKAGGFDPAFTKGLGDYHEADISFKIANFDYKLVFNPHAIVYHRIGKGTAENRGDAYNRMRNFVRFYNRHLKRKYPHAGIKFNINLTLQNAYFVYKFFTTGNISNLGAIPGTIQELVRPGG